MTITIMGSDAAASISDIEVGNYIQASIEDGKVVSITIMQGGFAGQAPDEEGESSGEST